MTNDPDRVLGYEVHNGYTICKVAVGWYPNGRPRKRWVVDGRSYPTLREARASTHPTVVASGATLPDEPS